MGQFWNLVNLDTYEMRHMWGELGECLFDGSPNWLNRSLRVAPKLPDRDSLIFPFEPGALYQDPLEVERASFEPSFTPRVMYFPQPAAQSSVLANLPAETILEVYSHLKDQDLADVVCLGITCQSLWNIGRAEIYRLLEIRAANWNFPWAGDRIICVGDYLRRDDLPANVLSPEEVDEFTGLDEDGEYYYTLYTYPFDPIAHPRNDFTLSEVLFPTMDRLVWRPELHVLRSLVDIKYTAPKPTQPAVLRNVSRLQYIRESALVTWKARAQTEIKETKDVGFGQIVLSRICFSTDSTVAMAYEGDIHRGVWAGDRFDIVGSEWLEGLGGAAGWTDVSDEVLAEVEAIWRSEYGYRQ